MVGAAAKVVWGVRFISPSLDLPHSSSKHGQEFHADLVGASRVVVVYAITCPGAHATGLGGHELVLTWARWLWCRVSIATSHAHTLLRGWYKLELALSIVTVWLKPTWGRSSEAAGRRQLAWISHVTFWLSMAQRCLPSAQSIWLGVGAEIRQDGHLPRTKIPVTSLVMYIFNLSCAGP